MSSITNLDSRLQGGEGSPIVIKMGISSWLSENRKRVGFCLLFIGSATLNLVLLPASFRPRPIPLPLPFSPFAHCKIPDLPLFDNETRAVFMAPPPPINCTKDQEYEPWTLVDWTGGNRIRIREPEPDIKKNTSIRCGYQVITRANESAGIERDWQVNVSPLIPIPQSDLAKGFDPEAEFVQVSCGQKIEYHAIPTIANNPRRELIQRKLDFWKGKEEDLPPNILLIGHDSTTRLNFRRHGKEMVKVLESLGAHEMKGYVKVGFNTFPNVVPLLSGYSLPEYESACLSSWTTDFQDSCPLLFSKLDQLHYITACIEDVTEAANFHYKKRGFFNQSTDFNPRPLQLQDPNAPPSCTNFLLNYLTRTTDFARNKAPLVTIFFNSGDTHNHIGGLQYWDQIYARLLSSLDLSNTILFVFGDHGLRFGKVAVLMQGQLEGNLPNLWVRLGEKVKRRWPEWENALQVNEQRILSPFNFYSTLNKILDSYAEKPVPLVDAVEKGTGIPIPRRPFISFFEPQKVEATCAEIGVPVAFCPCGAVEPLVDTNPLTKSAAKFALAEINSRLKKFPCKELHFSLEGLRGGTFLEDKKALLMMFGTTPGNAEVQAKLELAKNGTVLQLLHSDRLNRIDQTFVASCSGKLSSWAELFCVCKP